MASRVETSNLSVISEDKTSPRKYHDVTEDCESIYNTGKSKSAYAGSHKKKLHPLLLGPSRRDPGKYVGLHAASKTNLSEFTQRIMSAKLLRVKQVQNQLTETQIQLNELINENRILRNLQKRQEGALKKYEGNHAELPQLIRSHNEEIRTLKAANKILKSQLRDTNTKLKERENELENLRDNYNKLKKLTSEKNLMERDKLQKKVEELQEIIKEQDEKIQVLSRKILLESKNYRHHLNIEMNKHKETQKDLNNALATINKLESQLLTRDRINAIPGGPARLPIKNIHKSMPIITSKALENHMNNANNIEDDYRDDFEPDGKTAPIDSPDSDSEILKNLMSSDDSPSPTPDIFPEINPSKKSSPEITKSTEITALKSETLPLNCDMPGKHCSGLKNRKTPLPKKNSKISSDLEMNAKMISEKLSEDIQTIDKIVHEKTSNFSSPNNRRRLNSLYQEVKINASILETEIDSQITKSRGNLESLNLDNEEVTKAKISDVKRNVPKRKLDEEKDISEDLEKPDQDLSESQQQKLISMTKTWNDIKDKIQEERMKAEEKMKELCKMKSDRENVIDDSSTETDSESIDKEKFIKKTIDKVDVKVKKELENQKSFLENEMILEEKKELKLMNFTNDQFILTELEKTDKMFKKLRNETRKPLQKSSSLGKRSKDPVLTKKSNSLDLQQLQESINYRTTSRTDQKSVECFQNEHQKQNLLKALKAIDVGKDPNYSTDESEQSDCENEKSYVKHVQRISSSAEKPKNIMTEIFGTSPARFDKNENLKLEYGTVGGISARED